ncbi:ABC transporter ATP-binding protein [Swaminathania salitolerans]|uniref:Spermidine/putrescine import ATP-binding protein PotA 1 n=1 Tax=Swaminathania salitolerans TaxID=182838 RepID=A0A511BL43_9PROT|nr:ABC transporter ATP-binding protein [Swaminathania salitolerans]GBQ09857.1 spermidine/putrescine ABC transporter ATP-binding protein [Swaminathania salitolerans LMG 21291]GEL01071.1 spermidine/putrescine import ATP-binding protein PotA 1 [Swaminathania salitolerans]
MSASPRHPSTRDAPSPRLSSRPGPRLRIESCKLGTRLDAFCLDIHKNEAVSLLSDDPALPSMLCDVIAGFRSASYGSLAVEGIMLDGLPPESRPVVLVSPRDPLFPHLDVAGNIAFPLRVRGKGQQEIEASTTRILALVGLERVARTRISALDAGQRIRLALGRALAGTPSILLLDRIFAGLDLRTVRRLRQMIVTLQRALGLTLIHVAQDRDDALWLGGRIAIFDSGTLVQCADAGTLLDRPEDERIASLFGEANTLAGRVLSIDDDIARIHLACGGVVEAIADERLEADALCVLCIRPDRIAPLIGSTMAMEEDTPPLMATIQTVLHAGDQIRLRLRLADGSEIEIRRPLLQAMRGVTPGATVQLAWQASQAVAFPMKDDL